MWRIALLACLGLVALDARAQAVAVTWDDDDGVSAGVAALSAEPPFALATPVVAVGRDGVLHVAFGRVYHLSRATAELSVLDASSGELLDRFSLDPNAEPRDVLVLDAGRAWITRKRAARLLELNLNSGAQSDGPDLSPVADSDGVPEAERMLRFENRVYVQLRRESDLVPPFEPPAGVAVIEVSDGSLVDADPITAGIQAIALAGSSPRFGMQVVPSTRELWLSATGYWMDGGGIERIDVDGLTSLGLVIDEHVDDVGADLGAFVLTGPSSGWLSFSTDIVLSSHLHAFSVASGVDSAELQFALFYFTPALVLDASGTRMFWPEPGGVRALDAATGLDLAPTTALSGNPTDLAWIPSSAGIPLAPLAALALLACALGGASALAPRRRP